MNNWVTRKFQFGAGFGEIINEELAIQQMRARNFLRNELVSLDHATREKYLAVINSDNPAQDRIIAINAEIATLNQAIKMLRVPKNGNQPGKGRVKVGDCPEKEQIAALKKERKDLAPIARATRLENKGKSGEVLAQLNDERQKAGNALRARALVGYTHTHTTGDGVMVQVEVPALYTLNADELITQHETERGRAMKDNTELRFHSFIGEGRSSVRVHSHRDLSDGKKELFETLQNSINALAKQRRETKSKEVKQSLSKQIEAAEAERDGKVPNYIGQSEEETFAGDSTLFRINPVNLQRDAQNPTVWSKTQRQPSGLDSQSTIPLSRLSRADARRHMRTVAHIRINSTEKGKPIFVSVPIVMHRPFPIAAKILSAAVNRQKIGMRFRWNVEFTVRYEEINRTSGDTMNPETSVLSDSRCDAGTVSIDLGWAKDSLPDADGRIRVAGVRERAKDRTETFTEFCLPASFTEYAMKLNDIQSIRDDKTNEAFTKIAAFREANEIADLTLRTLLDKAKASLTARKGKTPPVHHLRSAVWMLRSRTAEAQTELKDILEAWYERWIHLNEWLSNGRDNQLAAKKDYYRRFAYALAQRNNTLLLDADNFAKMAKEKPAEHDEKPAKNDLRFLAAPAMLRSALEACFTAEKGKRILWTSMASSKTCSKCWSANEASPRRTFTCTNCGHTDDRESNATANIMGEFMRKPGMFSADKKVAERLSAKKAEEQAQAVVA